MLCRRVRQTLFAKKTLINNVQYECLITSRFFSKRCFIFDSFLGYKSDNRLKMSSLRFVLRDLSVARFWGSWTRSFIVNTVVKRCRREKTVREVFQCFRQTILRHRRTFLLSATAAFKSDGDDNDMPPSCEQSITDEELEALVTQLEDVEHLSRSTLFCTGCGKRLLIDKKLPAVRYCACKDPKPAEEAPDGWMPYMEAEDVVIWRKEYKPGQGLYAYKVYGRYKEVRATDFAAVQVDGAYRRVWDAAVASLSVVERRANGVRDQAVLHWEVLWPAHVYGAYRRVWDAAVASLSVVERRTNGVRDQAVLHWEVLWPRLFANRDYVYIRRHKEFQVQTPNQRDSIFETPVEEAPPRPREPERANVHSRAKRISQEADRRQLRRVGPPQENKAFIIVSRACTHPSVPETKHAIRVNEYWSHMVVRSIDGAGEAGMEFVLTYYDEPSVGGRCSAVAAWATGRAAAAYLEKMRDAASAYQNWTSSRPQQDLPDFSPFGSQRQTPEEVNLVPNSVREQDMESSKHGPELENGIEASRDQATQTDTEQASQPPTASQPPALPAKQTVVSDGKAEAVEAVVKAMPEVNAEVPSSEVIPKKEDSPQEKETEKSEEEDPPTNGSWWRYLYPFYYFV